MSDKRFQWRGKLFWWALVRGPRSLPVIFQTRDDARVNRDPDETLIRVMVVHPRYGRGVTEHAPKQKRK